MMIVKHSILYVQQLGVQNVEIFCMPSVDILKDFVAQHGLIDMVYMEIMYVI